MMFILTFTLPPETRDEAIARFSISYADQNEKDHDALERAVRTGKVKAVFEEAG